MISMLRGSLSASCPSRGALLLANPGLEVGQHFRRFVHVVSRCPFESASARKSRGPESSIGNRTGRARTPARESASRRQIPQVLTADPLCASAIPAEVRSTSQLLPSFRFDSFPPRTQYRRPHRRPRTTRDTTISQKVSYGDIPLLLAERRSGPEGDRERSRIGPNPRLRAPRLPSFSTTWGCGNVAMNHVRFPSRGPRAGSLRSRTSSEFVPTVPRFRLFDHLRMPASQALPDRTTFLGHRPGSSGG